MFIVLPPEHLRWGHFSPLQLAYLLRLPIPKNSRGSSEFIEQIQSDGNVVSAIFVSDPYPTQTLNETRFSWCRLYMKFHTNFKENKSWKETKIKFPV